MLTWLNCASIAARGNRVVSEVWKRSGEWLDRRRIRRKGEREMFRRTVQRSARQAVASSISLKLASLYFRHFLFFSSPRDLFLSFFLFLSRLTLFFVYVRGPSSLLNSFSTTTARLTSDAFSPHTTFANLETDRPTDQPANQPTIPDSTIDFAARLHPRGKFYLPHPPLCCSV